MSVHSQVATVFQVERDQIRIRCIRGYEISVMVRPDGAEAFISSIDGTETVRLKIEGPKPGQKIGVIRNGTDEVDVVYRDDR